MSYRESPDSLMTMRGFKRLITETDLIDRALESFG